MFPSAGWPYSYCMMGPRALADTSRSLGQHLTSLRSSISFPLLHRFPSHTRLPAFVLSSRAASAVFLLYKPTPAMEASGGLRCPSVLREGSVEKGIRGRRR